MVIDIESISLRELLRIQDELAAVMTRRFQRNMALGFSDIVGSTEFFKRFGDAAGRSLLQRHIAILKRSIGDTGRIVDTAGDGAFICFASMDAAAGAACALQRTIKEDNESRLPEQRLVVRVGLHFGRVLADDEAVSGDAVNVCARIAGTASPSELRLSKEAFFELSPRQRVLCRKLPPAVVKGVAAPLEVMALEWLDPAAFPTAVIVQETETRIELPDQPTIRFGRLDEVHEDGTRANDVVLSLPDARQTERISRWHFELRRGPSGMVLRSLSDNPTIVDGTKIPNRGEAPIVSGSVVSLSRVITLTFTREVHSDRYVSTVVP